MLLAVCCFGAYRAAKSKIAVHCNALGGVLLVLYAIGLYGVRFSDGFQADLDLPLALCDIVFLLCAISFWRPSAIGLTLVTFWGLTGTLQALITPDVETAFPSREFLLFFVGHSVIVVAIFFLLGKTRTLALGGLKGVRLAFGWLIIYSVLVGGLDLLFGWNYGYLVEKPAGASVLDYFGPWPVYVGVTLTVALVLFAILGFAIRHMVEPE